MARLWINKACGSGFIKISNVAKRNLRHARISHAFMYVGLSSPKPERRVRRLCLRFHLASVSVRPRVAGFNDLYIRLSLSYEKISNVRAREERDA